MQTKFAYRTIIIVVVAALVGGMIYLAYQESQSRVSASVDLKKLLKEYPEQAELIKNIQEVEELLKKDPDLVERYAQLGLAWKSLAEQLRDKRIFGASRDVYVEAIELTNKRSSIYMVNAGVVSELMEEYAEAERYYLMSIENAPADTDAYLKLAVLYTFRMNKEASEVLAVYDRGIKTIVLPTPLIQAKAEYLKNIGDNKGALILYKALYSTNPTRGLKELIAELEKGL